MLTPDEVRALAADLESDRVERTVSTTDTDKFRDAICSFANDLADHGKPGYLLVGVDDKGNIAGAKVTDQLLTSLSSKRDDGQIQPLPSMAVAKVEMGGGVAVAVVEVFPSDSPPVRSQGRIRVRVGPRCVNAGEADERRLTERRISRARTFDQRACTGAGLNDLLVDSFRTQYLPKVVAPEVLAANERTIEDRLASLRFFDPGRGQPTNAAMLLFGLDPLSFLPGAYVQFVRFDGLDLSAPVQDDKALRGNLLTQLQELDNLLPIQIRTARVPAGGLRHEDVPDYPLSAVREIALNALMHRSYEGTNAPVRINWFSDRVEIQNPGGLYGQVKPENFGRVSDYRNPVLAEAMSALGYVDKYGTGISRTRAALRRNGNPEPGFEFQPEFFLATLRGRA
ncbi:MAG: ATP-binding protein [Myxococcales bacterium]